MRKDHFCFLILFLFLSFLGAAQNKNPVAHTREIDSLLSLLKKDKAACNGQPCEADSGRVNHLTSLSLKLSLSNPDTAMALAEEALALAQNLIRGKSERSAL